MATKKDDVKKYFVTRIKGNTETVLSKFDDIEAAQIEYEKRGKALKPDNGIICLVKGKLTEGGEISSRGREDLGTYDEWLINLLKS